GRGLLQLRGALISSSPGGGGAARHPRDEEESESRRPQKWQVLRIMRSVLWAGQGWRTRVALWNSLLHNSAGSRAGAGLARFTSGSHSYDTGSRKCEFRQREKGRVAVEPGLSRSAGARRVLAAHRSCPSHVGPTLLTDPDLLDEQAPLEESAV
ncbi:unnamed protein product, partial [Gulo gulo]